MTIAALIVAAGRGTRLGADRPKQYLPLGDKTVIHWTLQGLLALPQITTLLTVIHADDRGLYDSATAGLTDPRLMAPVPGGATRALSVRAGLDALVPVQPRTVLIHDAARPFQPAEVITATLAATTATTGAVAALPVVDALWSAKGTAADSPVPREGLWRAQTPQVFPFASLLAAHHGADPGAADDVAVARAAGLEVTLVPGSEDGFKITTAADYARAKAWIKAQP